MEKQEIESLLAKNSQLASRVGQLSTELAEKTRELEALSSLLREIKTSTAWKLVRWLWKLRLLFFPLKDAAPATPQADLQSEGPAAGAEEQAPLISIIIPVYNNLAYTQQCLASIMAAQSSLPFEVILVNNGSNDETRSWFESCRAAWPNVHMLSLDVNLGFGGGVNVGLRQARGDFFVILNNDTLVTPNWLETMLAVLEQDDRIAIVSPVTNYTAKGYQLDAEAAAIEPGQIDAYAQAIRNREKYRYEPYRLAFFCVMLRRKVVDSIGLIDERYRIGNFEDYDFCFRAVMAGYRLAVAMNSFVYHFGSATFKANHIPYMELLERNASRYYARVDEMVSTILGDFVTLDDTRPVETSIILMASDRTIALERALMSLANQVYRDFEVILVENGRQEISPFMDSFSKYFPLRRVHRAAGQSPLASLVTAIRQARGKWVGYLEGDDFLYPWHLECLVGSLKEEPQYQFACSNYNLAWVDGEVEKIPWKIEKGPTCQPDGQALASDPSLPIQCWLHEKQTLLATGCLDRVLGDQGCSRFILECARGQKILHVDRITCEERIYNEKKALHASSQRAGMHNWAKDSL